MSDGMGREPAYLSSHATNRYFIPNWGKRENARMAEKYKVTWSSLFLVRHKDGKEKAENLTEYAFAHSRRQPEVFKAGVTQKIKTALK